MTNREALNKSPFTLNEVKGLTAGCGFQTLRRRLRVNGTYLVSLAGTNR